MKRLLAAMTAALMMVSLISAAPAFGATPPPNLNGEGFFGYNARTAPGTHVSTAICSPSGNSTISLTVDGTASGPYPGTFTEQVTAVVTQGDPANLKPLFNAQPDPIAIGHTVSLHATFTITSGTTTITGTNDFVTGLDGLCADFDAQAFYSGPLGLAHFSDVYFWALKSYTATIHTPNGSFTDAGSGYVEYVYQCFDQIVVTTVTGCSEVFSDTFVSTNPTVALGPDAVTLSPAAGTNDVGTSHTVTATATSGGQPFPGSTILFRVQGSVTTTGSCVTDGSGQCSFTYTGPQLPGADVITGCADNNGNGIADVGEPCGQATEAWLLPTSTPGQVTGGGQLARSGSGQVAFGFTAKSSTSGPKGECTIVDTTGADTKIKCTDVTALVQTGNVATLFGDAMINGVPTTYRIDVIDNGEPGAGYDSFAVQTSSGYSAGGIIARGNIQVH